MHSLSPIFALFSLLTQVLSSCPEWDAAATRLNSPTNRHVSTTCSTLKSCDGLTCSGHVQSFVGVSHVTWCVDFVTDTCHSEPAVSVHLFIPQLHLNTTRSLSHDDSLQLTSTHAEFLGVNTEITWFLHVTLEKSTNQQVEFGVELRGRVGLGSFSYFPSMLRLTIIPKQPIPAPPCRTDDSVPIAPPTCRVIDTAHGSTTRRVATTPTSAGSLGSPCVHNSLTSVCLSGLSCVYKANKSYCACLNGQTYSQELRSCLGRGRTAATPTITESTAAPSAYSHTTVIAASSSAAVILAAVVVVVVIVIRRRKLRHQPATLSLSVEPDDEPLLL